MTEALVTKCLSAYRAHPNTRGCPTGTLKTWLDIVISDPTFRQIVQAKEGNALADETCKYVERHSAEQGKPWKRVPPKATQAGGAKEEKSKEESGWKINTAKKAKKQGEKAPCCTWVEHEHHRGL